MSGLGEDAISDEGASIFYASLQIKSPSWRAFPVLVEIRPKSLG